MYLCRPLTCVYSPSLLHKCLFSNVFLYLCSVCWCFSTFDAPATAVLVVPNLFRTCRTHTLLATIALFWDSHIIAHFHAGGPLWIGRFAMYLVVYQRVSRLYVGMAPTRHAHFSKQNDSELPNAAVTSHFRHIHVHVLYKCFCTH